MQNNGQIVTIIVKDHSRLGRNRLVVGQLSAEVVKEIFNLFVQGHGTCEIARILKEKKILTPSEYNASISTKSNNQKYQYKWCGTTVAGILDRQEYIGDTVNFKYTTRSYKDKTRLRLPKEDRKIFKNTHEPIIDEYIWNIAKLLRKSLLGQARKVYFQDDYYSAMIVVKKCISSHQ